MIAKQAKVIAHDWVANQGRSIPGFHGALFHGSVSGLADAALLATTSDLDLLVVIDRPRLPAKPGKRIYQDVLLDVTYLPREQVRSAGDVLGQYHLAGSFRAPGVIADPSGDLTSLQAAVACDFVKPEWVARWCDHGGQPGDRGQTPVPGIWSKSTYSMTIPSNSAKGVVVSSIPW